MANNNKFVSRENAKTLWGYMIDLLTGKQNKLTFDDTPTQSSDNPVKSGGIFTALAGKGTYSRPQNGIPKTDLESAVQTSLGLADSALQSETDPTVPNWAKADNKPTYNSDEISDTNRTHKFATQAQLNQISTNQTNILYTANRTGKNNYNIKNENSVFANTDTVTIQSGTKSVTATINADGSVTLTGATEGTTPTFILESGDLSRYAGMYLSGAYSDKVFIQMEQRTAPYDIYAKDTGSGAQITSSIPDQANFFIRLSSNFTIPGSITLKPMICDVNMKNIDPSYQPYALPNYDLTQGLAELNAHPFLTVPINHNMVYRGKNLGDTFTDAQHTALSGGNFTDLYLGDYWTKTVTIPAGTYTGGDSEEVTVPAQTNITLKAVIADFDTFYAGYASTYAGINTHHAAVIVTGFSNVVWNKTNRTANGYVASLIHKWLVGSALPQIETWFGSAKVLSHQKLLTNAITGDAASGWAWSSQKISLLSENQMYGSKVWGNSRASNGGYEPGEAFKHLNIFNHIDANLLFGNKNIWLRDIAYAGGVADLYYGGHADTYGASNTGIAPAALILLS